MKGCLRNKVTDTEAQPEIQPHPPTRWVSKAISTRNLGKVEKYRIIHGIPRSSEFAPPPLDRHRVLGMVLLQNPMEGQFLMSEVPL